MKKLLVTGSNGFVGSSFINQYRNRYEFEKFSLLVKKLEDISFNDINIILHCAALVHQELEHSYEKYYEINVEYPYKLAKLSKENGIKQFIFISTIAVYGEDKEILMHDSICNPVTSYGKSKLEAEKELMKLNDDSFIVGILRPPMIYGKNAPGNIDTLVKFIKKLPIIPLGGIKNKRSFISIQNLCHLIDEIISQERAGIFLASDDKPLSTSKLIELIAKNLDKKVYLIKVPFLKNLLKFLKPSFHKRLYGSLEVDNTLTKEKLNLTNPYSVEKGIELMVKGENT